MLSWRRVLWELGRIRGGAIPCKCFRGAGSCGNGGTALPLNAFVGLGPVGKPTAFPFQMLLWGWLLETGALLFLRALS